MVSMRRTFSGSAVLVVGAAILTGCGGGDVGPGEFAYGSAPRCTRTMVIDSELANTQVALTRLHELVSLASISPDGADGDDALRQFDIAGDCGGWIYFTPEESVAGGATDYALDLQAYCMPSAEGPITFTGQISSTELAQVTEDGSVASELLTDFTGLQAHQGSKSFVVSMSDGRTVYGNPSSGRPQPADESSPDQVSIGVLVVNDESAGIVDQVSALQGRSWDQDGVSSLLVDAGNYLHGQSGDLFSLSTKREPLQVDPESGDWLSGTLVLTSSNNPPVEVRPSGTAGEYLAVVPGNRAGDLAGCSVVDKLSATR